ncbi:hypothetical protein ACN38_g4583 [Penicillium nordicum]|uniref:Uncharacterized protein n=1 Tax=Penicillium nordicum TaxID=229535 RepID=A0A0M9WGY4_9EURO|nr:hypothetical protein ACN38_g4583 [Penicillium nordicum]
MSLKESTWGPFRSTLLVDMLESITLTNTIALSLSSPGFTSLSLGLGPLWFLLEASRSRADVLILWELKTETPGWAVKWSETQSQSSQLC